MKKMMALLMALMMLALPLAGLAENGSFMDEALAAGKMVERTVTFKAADSLTGTQQVDQLISEVLDALKLTVYQQENDGNQGGLTVNMSGKDVLDIQFALKDGTAYLQSDLLAGNTLAVSADETGAAAEKIVGLMQAMGLVQASEAAEIAQQLETALTAMTNPAAASGGIDFEKMAAGFEAMNEQFVPEKLEWLADRVKEADLSGQPEGSDTAIRAIELEMTAEDELSVYEFIFDALKGNEECMKLLDSIAQASDEGTSGAALFDELMGQMKELLPALMQKPAKAVYYVNGDDEIVAATIRVELTDGETEMNMDMVYARKTEADGVSYHVTADVTGSEKLTMDVLVKTVENGFTADVTVVSPESDTLAFSVASTTEKTDTTSKSAGSFTMQMPESAGTIKIDVTSESAKNGDDATGTTVLTVSFNGQDMITVTTESKTAAPVASLATGAALHPAQMSDAELQAFVTDVANNLQVWATAFLQSLPTSVLMTMMN